MRNWNQYLELWQQKRSELPIDTDAQTDWSEMHDLLDKHLPVQNPGTGGSNTGSQASNLANQLSHLIKLKLFYAVSGLILAGAVTYAVLQHREAIKNNKVAKTEIRKDSLANHNDSLSASNNLVADSLGNHQNLSATAIPATNSQGKGNANTGQPAINNKADASSIKNNKATGGGSANNNRMLSASNNLTNGLRLNSNGQAGSTLHSNSTIDVNSNNQSADGSGSMDMQNNGDNNIPLAITPPTLPAITLNWSDKVVGNRYYAGPYVRYAPIRLPNKYVKPVKTGKNSTNSKNSVGGKRSRGGSNSTGSDLDWGILAGINSNGGFTPKAQNHNFYGSLSPDIYLGLFSTYNLNDRWAVGLQAKFFTPHTINGTYNYTHKLTADTTHTTQILTISDARKVYTIDVPISAIYKVAPNVSFKAGAILSMPVKQVNGTNSFTISGPLRDSGAYYNSVTNDINASTFEKKIRVGASAGISFTYKALWLDATYNFQGQKITSALGGYNANANSLQLTIGIKFNKSKK